MKYEDDCGGTYPDQEVTASGFINQDANTGEKITNRMKYDDVDRTEKMDLKTTPLMSRSRMDTHRRRPLKN